MRYLFLFILTGIFLTNCSDDKANPKSCSVRATVVDLQSLDGCDFVFELEDGTRLLPERRTYVLAPTREDDPVYHYQFKDGAQVFIGFVESDGFSACMAGQMVFITCIADADDRGK